MADGEAEVPQETAEAEAPVASEPLDLMQALQMVLKKALAHDGLARGVNECIKCIEKDQALLCVLAQDCNQDQYTKLVEALCAEKGVDLLAVPERGQLGEWAGLCKLDAEGHARKVVSCSCIVVKDYGEETEGLSVLTEHLKNR
eukprot:scaffold115_cov304-Prasinococcus_capsulatus_cf.AAC.52